MSALNFLSSLALDQSTWPLVVSTGDENLLLLLRERFDLASKDPGVNLASVTC